MNYWLMLKPKKKNPFVSKNFNNIQSICGIQFQFTETNALTAIARCDHGSTSILGLTKWKKCLVPKP